MGGGGSVGWAAELGRLLFLVFGGQESECTSLKVKPWQDRRGA